MSSAIFGYQDYKSYLLATARESSIKGFKSRLAEAANCQRAYFSRVLNTEIDLTLEQAQGIAQYLKFDEMEEDFFLDLVLFARAGTALLKRKLKARLARQRKARQEIQSRLKTVALSEIGDQTLYYSSWSWAAIHIATGIPNLQTPSAIANHLQLGTAFVHDTLRKLEKMGLIKQQDGRWIYASGEIHLPRESPFTAANHAHWRMKALAAIQESRTDGVHYSVVHSHGREDFERLKDKILDCIEQTRQIVKPSPNEEMSCIGIDLFQL